MQNRKIFVVEDNAPYLDQLKRTLVNDLDEEEPIGESLVERALDLIDDADMIDKIGLVIVDLELSGGDSSGPADFEGRDKILPKLRSQACWIPVLAMSRYFTGDAHVLAEATPYGFDAALPKRFFSESRTYLKQWKRVRQVAAAGRVGILTGRDTHRILQLLEHKIELELGLGVSHEIAKYDRPDFEAALRMMELKSDRIVVDEVVQGFSGLSVVKLTCKRGARRVRWLLKFGSAIRKLDRELAAHRRMFVDGLTRHLSVPVLWWHPIVWGDVGMIAYEFEEEAKTLLEEVRREGTAVVLGKVGLTLEELYGGSEVDSMIPRKPLEKIVEGLSADEVKMNSSEMLLALIFREPNEELDRSVEVMVGPQHGDLHARNILVGRRGPVLIDFAHYLGIGEGGVPLLDLAKLFVDLWAFGAKVPLREILSGDVLRNVEVYGRWTSALIGDVPSDDEIRLFRMAAICQLAKYNSYDDVSSERKEEARHVMEPN